MATEMDAASTAFVSIFVPACDFRLSCRGEKIGPSVFWLNSFTGLLEKNKVSQSPKWP